MTLQPPAPALWRPLLDGAEALRALDVAREIAASLLDPSAAEVDEQMVDHMALGRGSAGIAIFLAELGAATNDDALANAAVDLLDRALDQAVELAPTGTLYGGTIGTGWVLSWFEGRLLEPGDGADDVDELAATLVDAAPWPSVDLIRGLVGLGVYLLGRLPRESARASLARLVERLGECATETDAGLTWWTDPAQTAPERAERYPHGFYDVGIAHGQAGNVAMLAGAAVAGVPGAAAMLRSATDWLRAQRLPDGGSSVYPSMVAATERPLPSRTAWCYGDAGVAVALLSAGQALGDQALVAEAVELGVTSAARTPDVASVVDTGICHGSAGLLHIYNRMAVSSGDERLAEGARRWYADVLARRDLSYGLGGFPRREYDDDDQPFYTARGGFLEGSAGVGLTLVAAATDRLPSWDAALLTTPPAELGAGLAPLGEGASA